ncbi:hypothetical protein ACFLQX_01770 [Bacteroidota bacterium]
MKRIRSLISIFILVVTSVNAQNTGTDSVSKAEVSKLSMMEGQWAGSGWMIQRDGQRHEFTQTENAQFKLDNTLLLVEGKGKIEGEIIHQALACISYNKEEGNYHFTSWLPNGQTGNFKAELIEGKFYWYPNDYVRNIFDLNENGQWHEIGEKNRGGNWVQYFEMTLDKL